MQIIDDEGNLFGYVNVVDALVVLLVLGFLVALAVGVFGGSGEHWVAVVDLRNVNPGYLDEINETPHTEVLRRQPMQTYRRKAGGTVELPYQERVVVRTRVSAARVGNKIELRFQDGLRLEGRIIDIVRSENT